jgi:hypothetical protein
MKKIFLVLIVLLASLSLPVPARADSCETGGCNAYGCWAAGGGCNAYGCWQNWGGCNAYGCWSAPYGSCNAYGCSNNGTCNAYGCPS